MCVLCLTRANTGSSTHATLAYFGNPFLTHDCISGRQWCLSTARGLPCLSHPAEQPSLLTATLAVCHSSSTLNLPHLHPNLLCFVFRWVVQLGVGAAVPPCRPYRCCSCLCLLTASAVTGELWRSATVSAFDLYSAMQYRDAASG